MMDQELEDAIERYDGDGMAFNDSEDKPEQIARRRSSLLNWDDLNDHEAMRQVPSGSTPH